MTGRRTTVVVPPTLYPSPPTATGHPTCNDVEYRIDQRPDGRYVLGWGDLVANAWQETYDDLPVALARLAVLLDSLRDDVPPLFQHRTVAEHEGDAPAGPREFVEAAWSFFNSQLEGR